MGLRCLLGHDFGSTEIERERQEDGNEMVVTVREVQSCERCGERKVLSENKEVTAIRTPEELGIDDAGAESRSPTGRSPQSTAEGGADAGDAGATSADATASEGADDSDDARDVDDTDGTDHSGDVDSTDDGDETEPAPTTADPAGQTAAAEGGDAPTSDVATDPASEDAEILGDDTREYGEWPDDGQGTDDDNAEADATAGVEGQSADGDAETGDEPSDPAAIAAEEDAELLGDDDSDDDAAASDDDESPSAEQTPWPDHDGADEGFSADDASSDGPGVDFGGGLTPQATADGDADIDTDAGHSWGTGNGETASGSGGGETEVYETSFVGAERESRDGDGDILSADAGGAGMSAESVDTEFFCPQCGHTRPTDASLRPGDICPECQRGYISERER